MPDEPIDLDAALARLPDLEDGSRFPAIDSALADELCAAHLAGAPGSIAALVGRLQPVDDGSDWKVRFLLHALSTHVCAPGREADRGVLLAACRELLDDARPVHEQVFVASELRLFADASAVPRLVSRLHHADARLVDAAAAALVAVGPPAAEGLRGAMDGASDHGRAAIENAIHQVEARTA